MLGFAIPLCLILSFYYLVIRKLQTVGPKSKSKEKRRSHRKVTKLVLTVITGEWTAIIISVVWHARINSSNPQSVLFSLSIVSPETSSPSCTAFLWPPFKKKKKTWEWSWHRKKGKGKREKCDFPRSKSVEADGSEDDDGIRVEFILRVSPEITLKYFSSISTQFPHGFSPYTTIRHKSPVKILWAFRLRPVINTTMWLLLEAINSLNWVPLDKSMIFFTGLCLTRLNSYVRCPYLT